MNDNHVPRVDTAGQSLSPEVLHELRTPLNQIIGYSEMLAEQAQEEGQTGYLPDLEKIRKAGRHMVAMLGSGAPQLPAAVRPSEMPKKSDSATLILGPASVDHPKAMILIVDDNEMNRDVLSRRLQRQGYEFDVAGSGRSALEMVKDRNFDLVMLDIMMPDMDGYEVLTRLKADETTRHVPVIMISALDELESVVRCIVLGAEDYLPKPFEPTLLKARINACLEKKWSHDREAKLYEQLQLSFVRLQELEKSRDDLTNMIVHDLRTPLTSLLTGMQTLDGDQGLDDFQREMVGISITGGTTLLGMINDLLDVEKMESGSMSLDYSKVGATQLLEHAAKQVASLSADKNLAVVVETEPDLPAFDGDDDKLRRVLVNLIGNAIKFTPSGGTLTLKAHTEYNDLVFSVTDTGEGIPAESIGKIFEKFGQVESRKGGRTMSTGLGLTFCKLAVLAHGGHIDVTSIPGVGSTFSFTIPLTKPTV